MILKKARRIEKITARGGREELNAEMLSRLGRRKSDISHEYIDKKIQDNRGEIRPRKKERKTGMV